MLTGHTNPPIHPVHPSCINSTSGGGSGRRPLAARTPARRPREEVDMNSICDDDTRPLHPPYPLYASRRVCCCYNANGVGNSLKGSGGTASLSGWRGTRNAGDDAMDLHRWRAGMGTEVHIWLIGLSNLNVTTYEMLRKRCGWQIQQSIEDLGGVRWK